MASGATASVSADTARPTTARTAPGRDRGELPGRVAPGRAPDGGGRTPTRASHPHRRVWVSPTSRTTPVTIAAPIGGRTSHGVIAAARWRATSIASRTRPDTAIPATFLSPGTLRVAGSPTSTSNVTMAAANETRLAAQVPKIQAANSTANRPAALTGVSTGWRIAAPDACRPTSPPRSPTVRRRGTSGSGRPVGSLGSKASLPPAVRLWSAAGHRVVSSCPAPSSVVPSCSQLVSSD